MNNIYALERRKLVDLDNVTQNVYEGANSDVNFARMLQTILRREPDIVLVDNCEDRETARIASRAAAEDRKIYMGIQAKDCFDALSKYVALLEDHAMAAKALIGVTNQRLMRVLCKDCREAFVPDEATLKKLNLPAEKIERFYRPPSDQKLDRKGKPVLCATCQGTGYVGRVGVFEVMAVDPAVAALIAEGAPMNRIKAQCRKNKMYYLQEEGLLKVIDGTTSMNEVLRCLGGNDK
jgi:type II secretory ATPase GspE/PulE/Tfp pilus assembly ATPase PilB-like protein